MKKIILMFFLCCTQTNNSFEIPYKKNLLKGTSLTFFYGSLYCGYKIFNPSEEDESYCNSTSIIYAAVGTLSLYMAYKCGEKCDEIRDKELFTFTQSIILPPAPAMLLIEQRDMQPSDISL